MKHYTFMPSKHLLYENRDLLLDNKYYCDCGVYTIVLGFSDFYFKVLDVVSNDLTIPYRKFNYNYHVLSDYVSFEIYFIEEE